MKLELQINLLPLETNVFANIFRDIEIEMNCIFSMSQASELPLLFGVTDRQKGEESRRCWVESISGCAESCVGGGGCAALDCLIFTLISMYFQPVLGHAEHSHPRQIS